jgi:hypothetical protein
MIMKKQLFLIFVCSCFLYSITAQVTKTIHGTAIDVSQVSSLLGEKVKWIECVDYCRNLKEGGNNDWRVPSFEEAILYRTSNIIKLPDELASGIWTTTPFDAKINIPASPNNYVVFGEAEGFWDKEDITNGKECRCVR